MTVCTGIAAEVLIVFFDRGLHVNDADAVAAGALLLGNFDHFQSPLPELNPGR